MKKNISIITDKLIAEMTLWLNQRLNKDYLNYRLLHFDEIRVYLIYDLLEE